MKRFTLSLFVLSLFLFSCDKIEQANTIDFDTSLSIDIPVAVVAPTAMIQKSTEAEYEFVQSKTARLSDISEINDYLDKIKSIDLNNIVVNFSKLQAGQEINSIEISVIGVGVLASFQSVTQINATHTPTIDQAKLAQVATILNSTKELTVKVEGTTNEAPMDFTVGLDFDLHVEAQVL
jgi:hypothetical protein